MEKVQDALRGHYASKGYLVNAGLSEVKKRYKKLLGRRRYARHLDLVDRYVAGELPVQSLYQVPTTVEEANVLMSHQAEMAIDLTSAVYRIVLPRIRKDTCLFEMGCWTGAFASFLAGTHPGCNVIGADREAPIVAMARESNEDSNLTFVEWDYAREEPPVNSKADIVVSVLGIDLDQRSRPVPESVEEARRFADPSRYRDSSLYRRYLDELGPVFRHWRIASGDGADLCVALRTISYQEDLPIIDAASFAGWSWNRDASEFAQVGNERFPIFYFIAGQAGLVDTRAVVQWRDPKPSQSFAGNVFGNPAAWLLYRDLPDRQVTDSKVQHLSDHYAFIEYGSTAGKAYGFYHASAGEALLALGDSEDEVEIALLENGVFWAGRT